MYIDLDGVINKKKYLRILLDKHNPALVILTETKFNEEIPNQEKNLVQGMLYMGKLGECRVHLEWCCHFT